MSVSWMFIRATWISLAQILFILQSSSPSPIDSILRNNKLNKSIKAWSFSLPHIFPIHNKNNSHEAQLQLFHTLLWLNLKIRKNDRCPISCAQVWIVLESRHHRQQYDYTITDININSHKVQKIHNLGWLKTPEIVKRF